MTWNWQRSDWPDFAWDKSRLAKAEECFLIEAGTRIGAIRHLGSGDRDELVVEAMSTEAVTTSEIEGEILDRASVQSSIRRQLGLGTDNRRVAPAERGVAEMMVDLYRNFAEPLSHEMLFGWHRMLASGWSGIEDIGGYRTHPDAMQVVSGIGRNPQVHFEAPPSSAVPGEMERFVAWFNRTALIYISSASTLSRTAMAGSVAPLPRRRWRRTSATRRSPPSPPRSSRGAGAITTRSKPIMRPTRSPLGCRGSRRPRSRRGGRSARWSSS
jgi:Fic family protein